MMIMDGDNGENINTIEIQPEKADDVIQDEEQPLKFNGGSTCDGSESPSERSDSEFSSSSSSKQEADQRGPVKLHIKLSSLSGFINNGAYTRKRKPKWYCYQCRITFFKSYHLDLHLKEHVKESDVKVKLTRLPLPEEVVSIALNRYKAAELLKHIKAELKAQKEFAAELVSGAIESEAIAQLEIVPVAEALAVELPEVLPNISIVPVTEPEPEVNCSSPPPEVVDSEKTEAAPSEPSSSVAIEFSIPDEVKLLENKMNTSTSAILEPDRCQSVMIIENDSSATCFPKIATAKTIVPPSPLSMLSQIDPTKHFGCGVGPPVPPPPLQPQPRPLPSQPQRVSPALQQRLSPAQQLSHLQQLQQQQQAAPRIQEVVSLANSRASLHVDKDADSSCCCSNCMEIRCGDLLRKSQINMANGEIGYQCTICRASCSRKSLLLRHCRMMSHSYLCELCGSGFLKEELFRLHGKLHLAKQQSATAKNFTAVVAGLTVPRPVVPSTIAQPQLLRPIDMIRTPLSKFSTQSALRNTASILKNKTATLSLQGLQSSLRTQMTKSANDDEVVVLGEKRQLSQMSQRQNRPLNSNILNSPTQLSRILHNSEITLTPINTTPASAFDNGNGSMSNGHSPQRAIGIGSSIDRNNTQLYQHLKKNNVIGNPPNIMTSTLNNHVRMSSPVGNQSSELRRAITSSGGYLLSQQRPTAPQSQVYRMMPLNKTSPPTLNSAQLRPMQPNPTWHHPVAHQAPPHLSPAPSVPPLRPPPPAYSSSLNAGGTGLRYSLPQSLFSAASRQLNLGKSSELGQVPNRFPYSCSSYTLPTPPRLINTTQNGVDSNGQPRGPPMIAPVRCHVCNMVFHSIAIFQSHFDSVHKSQYNATHYSYKCGRCDKMYNQLANFKRHEALCSEKLACKKCNQSFYRNELLAHYSHAHPTTQGQPTSTCNTVSMANRPRLILPKPTDAMLMAQPRMASQQVRPALAKTSQILMELNKQTLPTPEIDIVEVVSEPQTSREQAEPDITIAAIVTTSPVAESAPIILELESYPVRTGSGGGTPVTNIATPEPEAASSDKETADNNNDEATEEQILIPSTEECNSMEPEATVPATEEEAETMSPSATTEAEPQTSNTAAEMEPIEVLEQPPEADSMAVDAESPIAEEADEILNVDSSPIALIEANECNEIEMLAAVLPCPVCDQTFEDELTLQDHLQMHREPSPDINTRKYTCTFCKLKFVGSRSLCIHLKSHFSSCNKRPKGKSAPSASPRKRLKTGSTSCRYRPPTPAPRKMMKSPEPQEEASNATEVSADDGLAVAEDNGPDLAVAILDMNKLTASADVLRRLGVVGFVSLKQLKSYILGGDSDGQDLTKLL